MRISKVNLVVIIVFTHEIEGVSSILVESRVLLTLIWERGREGAL